jgi:hypothetical protein
MKLARTKQRLVASGQTGVLLFAPQMIELIAASEFYP